jgi:murein DD-endopeptidase MepM/ murein hydrolase activator NlpD
VALGLTAASPGAAEATLVSARGGNLGAFSGGIQQVNGAFTATGPADRTDAATFAATYSGSGGAGQASGTFNVRWRQGQSIAYGATFYLPAGFHTAPTGQQALLTWDSPPDASGRSEQDAVVIDYSDNMGYLVANQITNGSPVQQALAGPFPLPIGTWFGLQVRQLLGSGSAAYSDVYVNGRLLATSRAPNFSGQQITDVRYGIVALSADAALGPVALDFDQATAAGYTGYVDPLGGDRYKTGRTDMGVDFCMAPGEPVRALGDGIVVGIWPDWFKHQPYLWYQLLDGPDAGRYVYVAEQIRRLVHVGTQLTTGQPIAYYKKSGTCLETGWSAANGSTLAHVTTGYTEGQVTQSGVSFAHFLSSLGVQGPFEFTPPPVKHKHPKRPRK